MATQMKVNVNEVFFPPRCVACGKAAEAEFGVECSSGIDLILIKFWRWHDLNVPVCDACKSKRRRLGKLFYIGTFVLALGWLIGTMKVAKGPMSNPDPAVRIAWVCIMLLPSSGLLYIARNRLTRWLDLTLLGICGKGFTSKGETVLWIRDDQFAAGVRGKSG